MKIRTILRPLALLALLPLTASAQMLFHEGFEVDPPEGQTILGNLNGWQEAWNREGNSQAVLADSNLHWESPFPARGKAIQINNTQQTAFRELPESLNGKTVYFSFLFRYFQEDGGTGQLRFRSNEGHVMGVGFAEDRFFVRAHGTDASWGQTRTRETYMVIGRVQVSEDGGTIRISANAYTTKASIPLELPDTWSGTAEHQGQPRRWNGVEFMAASQNVVYDDLRMGATWRDVAGTRR